MMKNIEVLEQEFGSLSRWSKAPDFWVAKPEQAASLIGSLASATKRVIGHSASGLEILALEYGEPESTGSTCDNLQSCLSATIVPPDPTAIYPHAFYGTRRRQRPVLAIQGAIHGGELSGTVAMLNLCAVIEKGCDLRGKAWPRLQELAKATRLLLIPWLNMDGVRRWPLANPEGAPQALYQRCMQGVATDGTRYAYPSAKLVFPIPPDKTAFMGCYYNDAGVNLEYDFCVPQRQPETLAWMQYYLQERPDAIVQCHCDNGSLISAPPYYVPTGHQHEQSRIGGAVRARLLREGYRVGRLSWAGLPGLGKPLLAQSDACYHVCGALPLLCELPSGTDSCGLRCDDMLDIGLMTYEEILAYAHRDGLRPYELWDKVKPQVQRG